jgi:VWFA-related protein
MALRPSSILFLLLMMGCVFTLAGQEPAEEQRFVERITVERIILDAYVTDRHGNPVPDLTPEDLEVRLGGVRAEIEAVDWIPMERRIVDERTGDVVVTREGRLIVMFIQTDFGRNAVRVTGQMQGIPHAIDFIEQLHPSDLVAVVSFDSHLKVRSDFINDHEILKRVIRESLRIDRPEPVPAATRRSLLEHLDLAEARAAANPEKALWLIGDALAEIHGAKTLVLFGWGLGVYMKEGVSMRWEYELARAALERARATVFSLDLTEADFHSLEVGLQKLSADTGGFYSRMYHSPSVAFGRLQRTLSGRYEIVLKRPEELGRGRHPVDLRVHRRGVDVLVAPTVTDR